MEVRKSGEDYLEAILRLREEKGMVHSIDVARKLNFSKPSVSHAVALLREGGFLLMDGDGCLHLTAVGEEIARRIYERHCVLTRLLTHCGVPPETAEQDACQIEHVISAESFEKIKDHFARHLDREAAPLPE